MINATKYFLVFVLIQYTEQEMEPFIVGGNFARIERYPHSAFLDSRCEKSQWVCGASILNQKILLTAAHCLDGCILNPHSENRVTALVGHANLQKVTIKRKVTDYIIHKDFHQTLMNNDIAVAEVRKDFPLGGNVKRIIISRNFPPVSMFNNAYVAGWGIIDPEKEITSICLKHVHQRLRSARTCAKIGRLHMGMFCAGSTVLNVDRLASGDSGSALVTNSGFQQIGLVSFCINRFPALMVYTNVTYYYTWIESNAQMLFCRNNVLKKYIL